MMKLRIFRRSKEDTCDSLWPLLSAYSDGETTESESARVEGHIVECGRCSSALSLIQNTSVSLATTREVEPPAYLRGAILAAASLDASPGKVKLARRPMRLQWGFGAAALAGVLAALVFHTNQTAIEIPDVNQTSPRELAQIPRPAPTQDTDKRPAMTPSSTPDNDPTAPAIETATAEVQDRISERDITTLELPRPVQSAPNVTGLIVLPRKTTVPQIKVATGGSKPSHKPKVDAPMTVAENAPMAPMDMMPEAAAPKIDMAVMSTPMPMEIATNPAEPVPPAAAEPVARKIILTAEPKSLPVGQISSLADLKKSLRQQSIQWNRPDAMRGLTSKQISVEIVKRSF